MLWTQLMMNNCPTLRGKNAGLPVGEVPHGSAKNTGCRLIRPGIIRFFQCVSTSVTWVMFPAFLVLSLVREINPNTSDLNV